MQWFCLYQNVQYVIMCCLFVDGDWRWNVYNVFPTRDLFIKYRFIFRVIMSPVYHEYNAASASSFDRYWHVYVCHLVMRRLTYIIKIILLKIQNLTSKDLWAYVARSYFLVRVFLEVMRFGISTTSHRVSCCSVPPKNKLQ